jgi:hypothetical protein
MMSFVLKLLFSVTSTLGNKAEFYLPLKKRIKEDSDNVKGGLAIACYFQR